MPCNIEKTKRISYYIDILFHIFASLHNIFYVLECMRLKKRRRVCYSAKKLRCSRGETTVLLHHSKEDEHPDQTFRLVSKNTGTV